MVGAARILGPGGEPVPAAEIGRIRMRAQLSATRGAYEAADPMGQDLGSWQPAAYSPDTALGWDRERLSARLHDLVRNDGWVGGAVGSLVTSVVGGTFRLDCRPDHRALGIALEEAEAVGQQIERLWSLLGSDPRMLLDASRRHGLTGLLHAAFRHVVVDGECLILPQWRDPSERRALGWRWGTCYQLVHPARLSNPYGAPDSHLLRGGIAHDGRGAPRSYHIRQVHPGEESLVGAPVLEWVEVPREHDWGRPQAIHYFPPGLAGQSRGVSPLAPIVRRARMIGRYEQSEVQAAVVNATLAAYIETSLPPEAALDILDDPSKRSALDGSRLDFYDAAPVHLGGVRIPVLPTGDRINSPSPSRPNREASAFVHASLRNIAAAIGANPSEISRDYSQTNYSSERAAMLSAWRTITMARSYFAAGVATPMLVCLVEEAVDRGDVVLPEGAPGLWEALGAWLRGTWIGPPRGWVDPVKEAAGQDLRIGNLTSTYQQEAAEQGLDWDEVVERRALEQRRLAELGLADAGLDIEQREEDGRATRVSRRPAAPRERSSETASGPARPVPPLVARR